MVRGQVPLFVSVMENEASSIAQLSEMLPPPFMKSAYDVNAGGTSPAHSKSRSPGQVMTGFAWSSIVIVCTHIPMLLQESAIEYVRVIVLGHVPLSVSERVNVVSTTPQLSETLPPPLMKSV